MTLKCDPLLEQVVQVLPIVPICQDELGGEYRLVLLRGIPRTDTLGRLWATCDGVLGMRCQVDKSVFQLWVSDSRRACKDSAMLLVLDRRGEAYIEEGLLRIEALQETKSRVLAAFHKNSIREQQEAWAELHDFTPHLRGCHYLSDSEREMSARSS